MCCFASIIGETGAKTYLKRSRQRIQQPETHSCSAQKEMLYFALTLNDITLPKVCQG